ncbi:MAG: thiamine pyrophosphate-binding protein [Desulfovibrionaceae bacterium]|nr:thiamine pyrophosphate-binding protein [Desulfovibrionaceae bacterium]
MAHNVAQKLASTFKACGVDKFFMLTGGDQALWIALHEAGIKMIVGHSEPSAVYMADGYARATGATSVTYGQAGPGAANVAAALADSYWAQSPVMALTGSTASDMRHANEYQALAQEQMFVPVTRWSGRVENPGQAAALLRHALQMTLAAGGPTHLDIPKDFFAKPSEENVPELGLPQLSPAGAGDASVTEGMVRKLLAAERPVIFVGEGVNLAKAWDELSSLSSAAGIPMVSSMGGKPAVMDGHSNFMGVVGRYSSCIANEILGQADVVLALGSRLGGLATNGYTIPSKAAAILQVDHCPSSFSNPYFPADCLLADIKLALRAMLQSMPSGGKESAWLKSCREKRAQWNANVRLAIDQAGEAGGISPLAVMSALREYGKDITVVADTGYMAAWTGVLYPIQRFDSFFRATGSLGWALPASLGVQMARKEKVVCVTGDGGAGYHFTDVETAVRYKLPVTIIILNNNCLAFEYHEQKYRWNGQVIAEADNFTSVDYAAAARALGAAGERVSSGAALRSALKKAMGHSGPTVIEVVTDVEAYPPVTNFEKVMPRTI